MTDFKSNLLKFFGVLFIIIVIASLTLVAAGKMSWPFFWIIIIISAFVAYYTIPWLKGQ
jgi:hypothetical protein